MMENSWNRSFKIMYKLPLATHGYFIEPISGKPHAKTLMMKNFVRFCELIMQSQKEALKKVFNQVKWNVLSYTGNNLRRIMKLMKKESISELKSSSVKADFKYKPVPEQEMWRMSILEELLEVRENKFEISGFDQEEIEEILEFVCTT